MEKTGSRLAPRLIIGVPDQTSVEKVEVFVRSQGLKGVEVVPLNATDVESMTRSLDLVIGSRGALGGLIYDSGLQTEVERLTFLKVVTRLDRRTLVLNHIFHMLLTGKRGIRDYSKEELQAMIREIIRYLPKPTPKRVDRRAGLLPVESQLRKEIGTERFPVHYASELTRVLRGVLDKGEALKAGDLESLTRIASGNEEDALEKALKEAISAQEEAALGLRLSLYHPSFRYRFRPETLSHLESPKAVVWTWEMIKDPFFFKMLDDRDKKIGPDRVRDYVLLEPGDDSRLREELGDEAFEAFVKRFGPDQLIDVGVFGKVSGIAPSAIFPFLPVETFNYSPKDVVFVDKLENGLIDKAEDDPTSYILIKLDGPSLTLDKVIVELLAMEGDIRPIVGLKPLEGNNIFIFKKAAPIDYQYQFRRYRRTRDTSLESA